MPELEKRGALFVPTEKQEPRRFASIRAVHTPGGTLLFAVSHDGAGFAGFLTGDGVQWQRLPDLPADG